GFQFAIEQLKVVFPDLDEAKLGELDALNKIVDGKRVPFAPTDAYLIALPSVFLPVGLRAFLL
ncbi:hypothetical protein A2U01_0094884, partial [Trifolium medium]|nr:hypothetical protein [Trifolium medium]